MSGVPANLAKTELTPPKGKLGSNEDIRFDKLNFIKKYF